MFAWCRVAWINRTEFKLRFLLPLPPRSRVNSARFCTRFTNFSAMINSPVRKHLPTHQIHAFNSPSACRYTARDVYLLRRDVTRREGGNSIPCERRACVSAYTFVSEFPNWRDENCLEKFRSISTECKEENTLKNTFGNCASSRQS